MWLIVKVVKDGQYYFLASVGRETGFGGKVTLEPIPLGIEEGEAGSRVLKFMEGTDGEISPSISGQKVKFAYGLDAEKHVGETLLEGVLHY